MDDRGQAYTLEAIAAALILVGGLLFALQATAVTPLSASTSSQHLENQQQSVAEGVLAVAAEEGELRVAVLNWDDDASKFYGATDVYYTSRAPENQFGALLERSFDPDGIIYNVYVRYRVESGSQRTQRLVYRGEPSDNAVSASRMITLFDDDVLYDGDEQPTATEIGSTVDFYASDAHPTTGVYNVIEVEVVAWRQ